MISSALYSSKSELWETPQAFFDDLDNLFHIRPIDDFCAACGAKMDEEAITHEV